MIKSTNREAGNVKESAKCLQKLFKKFPQEDRLWKEIDLIMAALKKSQKLTGRRADCMKIGGF
jgi:hypothetical protein